MYSDTNEATAVSCGHNGGAVSDGGIDWEKNPGPRATLKKSIVATAGSRDHDSSAPAPVSGRTRKKLMLSHQDRRQAVTSAEVHCSEGSSDEDEYEQAVTVGGRCEKLDAAIQCNDTVGGGSAT